MTQPLVSVVVATNRAASYLHEALASVASQSLQADEVIVVDDGCPDPSVIEIAAAAVNATVLHQAASGVSAARNYGASRSTGEFLVFLDDDDRWHPQRLALQVHALRTEPSSVASYCGLQTIDATGLGVLAVADQVRATRLAVAARRTGILLPNLLLRREAFERAGGFHSGIRMAEDYDLVLRLCLLGDFAFVPETLVDYRAHATNTTGRHRELVRSVDHVVELHRWAAQERGDTEFIAALTESSRRNARYAWWSALRSARSAIEAKHPGRAAGEMAWALRHYPAGLVDGIVRRLRP